MHIESSINTIHGTNIVPPYVDVVLWASMRRRGYLMKGKRILKAVPLRHVVQLYGPPYVGVVLVTSVRRRLYWP